MSDPGPAPAGLPEPAGFRLGAHAASLGLAVLVLAAFGPVLFQPFLRFDDLRSVPELAPILRGLSLDTVVWAFGVDLFANWIPLTVLSHALDWELWGSHPPGHYLTSLLLHAATAVGLFRFVDLATGARGRAFAVAGLWALHPLRVESVAWLAERKDVLSGFLAVLALLAYSRYARTGRFRWWLATGGLFVLGLLAKPMLVTLPFGLLLFDVWPLGRWRRGQRWRCIREKLPWLLASGAASLVALTFQGRPGTWHSVAESLPWSWRGGNALLAVAAYLRRTFWPTGLAAFYPLPPHPPAAREVLAAAGLLVLVSVAAVALLRRRPYVAIGWAWFLGTLVPVLGLVQVGRQASADRYTYLPSWGLVLAVVWLVAEVAGAVARPHRSRVLGALAVAGLLACTVATRQQLRFWVDDEALFRRVVQIAPEADVGHAGLGRALLARGEVAEGGRHLVRALQIAPGRIELYGEVAAAMVRAGWPGEAEGVLRKGIAVGGGDADLSLELAALLLGQGRGEEALAVVARAAVASPRHSGVWRSLDGLTSRVPGAGGILAEVAREAPAGPGRQLLLTRLARLGSSGPGSESRAAEEP